MSGTKLEGERKEGRLHGRLTYYKVNSDVFNEVWKNNYRVSSIKVEAPEDAWFGDGQPVVKKIRRVEDLVGTWTRDGFDAKIMKKI